MPITRDQAFALARDYVVTHSLEAFKPTLRVVDLDELRRERRRQPALYWVSKASLEECWLVYRRGSDRFGLFPSEIVAVSKRTGRSCRRAPPTTRGDNVDGDRLSTVRELLSTQVPEGANEMRVRTTERQAARVS